MSTDNSADQELHQCCGGPSAGLLPVAEGQRQILQQVQPLSCWEQVDVRQALGRILAADVISPINVPAYNNSAMDGYAVRGTELPTTGEARLKVVGNVLAGHPYSGPLAAGECVKIMTGAQVPEGLDTVIIKEVCHCDDGPDGHFVGFPSGALIGQNRRMAGEDLAQGSVAVAAGIRLGAAELGLIASLGQAEVKVRRKPRVAYFSTGDEINSLGEPLQAGQIYDSNRYTVTALLQQMGIEVLDLGVIRDKPEAIEEAFLLASSQADMVISSGGVSLGEADFVKDTLDKLGQVSFWRMAIKPGRPLAFGHVQGALFFGLPGNPVAVMITFLQFVKPALRKLAGESQLLASAFQVRCAQRLKKKPGRTEYIRAICSTNSDGELLVVTTGQQGSGILTSMSRANCLIVLEQERGTVETGDSVWVQPFDGLL
ncbi:MAG: bifunctional molybdopterin-guanine dinucleotide biosynthesis adaptor protein MobB/molybdopterin molybdotransferase MoeA [Motiliproteus sp.]